ncbi:MAG TPA: diguanylate cyclase [Rudaea sp.]
MSDAAMLDAAMLHAIVEVAPVALILVDREGVVVFANAEALRLFGYGKSELIGGKIEHLVPDESRASHRGLRSEYQREPSVRAMGSGRDLFGRRKDGARIPVEIALRPFSANDERLVLCIVADITERKRLERIEARRQVLERQIREDPLTHLSNRRAFDLNLARLIERSERDGRTLTAVMFDLDHFKLVNDRFGHATGDAVLERVSDLLRRECRLLDSIARYGGEEFALALPDCDLNGAIALCERVRIAFERCDWERIASGLAVRISAGVGVWKRGMTPRDLLAEADRRLYEAKQSGRNCVRPLPIALAARE